MSSEPSAVLRAIQRSCRVVLVRPKFAGNVGAVARVMRNMGLEQLTLVSPEADLRSREGRKQSTKGEFLLDQATIVSDLVAAIEDCVLVVGTSARTGGLFRRQTVGTPRATMPRLVEAAASGPVALVFGPETNGLTNDEVRLCHALVAIEADDDYPVLNLSHAVAICLYELRQAALARQPRSQTPSDALPVAPFVEQERMYAALSHALNGIGYLKGERGEALMHALRHLIVRAQPTSMEVKLLLGLARQIAWFTQSASNDDQSPAAPRVDHETDQP